MEKVWFITPNNESIFMNYYEVEDFCKKICLQEENLEAFEKFKRWYTYFLPYFDFVMIHKKYLFINCLFNKNNFIVFKDGAFYFSYLISDNYQDNINFFEEKQIYENCSNMTTVSNDELGIKKQSLEYEDDCMIDPNMIGMMSMTDVGSWYGSHIVTAATVLNQLLIRSELIATSYFKFLEYSEVFDECDAISYLIYGLGFLRVTCRESYPLVMLSESILSQECLEFVKDGLKRGYKLLNGDDIYACNKEEAASSIKEYKKMYEEK